MGINIYLEPQKITQQEATSIFSSDSVPEMCQALVAIAFYEEDWRWVQEVCLKFLNHNDPQLRRLAVVCLSHIVRIHRKLDRDLVVSILKEHLTDIEIIDAIEDTLYDIDLFLA